MNYFPKSVFFLLALVAAPSVATNEGLEVAEHLELGVELMAEFHSWVDEHEKSYDSHEEKLKRLQIWVENNERIQQHNDQDPPPSFTLGHNPFSDMTQDEFQRHFKLGPYSQVPPRTAGAGETFEAFHNAIRGLEEEAPADGVNWVGLGAVTPVKDQGMCGSCWAFSTTGGLEGAKFIKTGELVPLSEQNLLDCDHKDLGCNGGLMDNAFKFDEKSGGLCSEADYPYKAKQGKTCLTNCTDVPGSIVKTFTDVPPGSTKAMVSALTLQPISVAIQANQFVFQFYKHGIISDDSCGKAGNIDHGVLAVGYGTDPETQEPFFIVKNSWGAKWGDKGYVRMSRNSKNKYGMCAILKMASFPETE
ncbi:Senescence-specific cysteine protease SAG39 [Seminavis robusta]|uniref:Senescence-specific cysteine protease SAG39 n=1 Tax=Seminavis robusta TaxID=568900 RepID=A0A9N8DB36_9STRA|nr:Senescence-specific cysteine protease SAG39 [Seminavis robusta]|eukprot:Sro72_g039650.1 Senescence-specific cysteine protease SAG39 (361) ;mRNA; r:9076-10630